MFICMFTSKFLGTMCKLIYNLNLFVVAVLVFAPTLIYGHWERRRRTNLLPQFGIYLYVCLYVTSFVILTDIPQYKNNSNIIS